MIKKILGLGLSVMIFTSCSGQLNWISPEPEGEPVPNIYIYDPATGEWEILPDAPHTRDHFHAVVIKNKIYAAGGRNTSKNTNQVFDLVIPEVDVFDLKKQTWETFPESSDLPTVRAGTSAVNFKGKLLVIGGESMAHKEAHKEVEALDPKTGIWESMTFLNRGRHGTQAVVYKGKIYTASGSGNRGGGPELKTLEIASFE